MTIFLSDKKCIACENGDSNLLLSKNDIKKNLLEVVSWQVDTQLKEIFKEYTFKNFKEAISFVNTVATIAEEEGHHPDISIWYNRVRLSLTTHAVSGLTENDFIVAAKINKQVTTN